MPERKHLIPIGPIKERERILAKPQRVIDTGITGDDILAAAQRIEAEDRAAGRIGGIAGAPVGTEKLLVDLERHSPEGAALAADLVDALSQGHRRIELVMPEEDDGDDGERVSYYPKLRMQS